MNISTLGSHLLAFSFPLALFSFLISILGGKRKNSLFIELGKRSGHLVFLFVSLCVVTLIGAFLTDDFSLSYVYGYSSRSLPLFYKVAGLWAGLDGSILFWTWLVALYAFIILRKSSKDEWFPYVNAVMMGVVLFFITIMLFSKNPFTALDTVMPDGKDLNPLLQNMTMVIHPPCLYLGFTGFTVPFAYVLSALFLGKLDSTWIDKTRRWTLVSWTFLTAGLILGGAWAYVELGWGGFWAWDPVENAALMPWLLATAYIHSVMIQKKRGMLPMWNIVLVILTFLFTIIGTYLTRSGVVQSVHAFSESELGIYFLVFMGLIFVVSLFFVIKRKSSLKSQNHYESYFSREGAFLLNNIVLLVSTLAIFLGTMLPTFSEWIGGKRISVVPEDFNKFMAPFGLALLFLMGVGPLISWKKSTFKSFIDNFLNSLILGAIVVIVSFLLGVRHWYVLSSLGLISFVLGTIFTEYYRGYRALKIQQSLPFFSSLKHLLFKSQSRFAGYIVHLGILFVFLGIAGTAFKKEKDFVLRPGESFSYEGFNFYYEKPEQKESEHKIGFWAHIGLSKGDKKWGVLKPAHYYYQKSDQVTTEVDIYVTPLMDIYLIMGNIEPETARADFKVMLNPLISFIWLGGIVMLLGILLVMIPGRKNDGN